MPAVSDGYARRRDRIVAHVERLVAELAGGTLTAASASRLRRCSPAHAGAGGFDHAAVHEPTRPSLRRPHRQRCRGRHRRRGATYVGSVTGPAAVAGALAATRPELIVTSNRGENTVGLFSPGDLRRRQDRRRGPAQRARYDPRRGRLLAATSGTRPSRAPARCRSIDVATRRRIADLPGGRAERAGRCMIRVADAFHVNIMDPPQIVVVERRQTRQRSPRPSRFRTPARTASTSTSPGGGCSVPATPGCCWTSTRTAARSWRTESIAGVPDVVFFNAPLRHLYVAIGDPGLIEVFDTAPFRRHRDRTERDGRAHAVVRRRAARSCAPSCRRPIAPRCTSIIPRRSTARGPIPLQRSWPQEVRELRARAHRQQQRSVQMQAAVRG